VQEALGAESNIPTRHTELVIEQAGQGVPMSTGDNLPSALLLRKLTPETPASLGR
jgi:hypothetical protein